jgi:hypothetical protein
LKKCISILLLLSVLTISAMAEPVYHKPKITDGTTSGSSSNWAGYALDAPTGSVNDVKGSWIVPAVTCSNKNTYSSFWVGIDGDNSPTVEQIGTSSDCNKGKATYYAWYEFYPAYPVNIPVSVSPGNVISGEVNYDSATGLFTVYIINQNTSGSYTTTGTVSNAQRNSAEWIAEAPWRGTVLPLANFGTSYFGYVYTGNISTNYATIGESTGNISSFKTSPTVNINTITMASRSGVKAQPSAMSSDGTSFWVKWFSS